MYLLEIQKFRILPDGLCLENCCCCLWGSNSTGLNEPMVGEGCLAAAAAVGLGLENCC